MTALLALCFSAVLWTARIGLAAKACTCMYTGPGQGPPDFRFSRSNASRAELLRGDLSTAADPSQKVGVDTIGVNTGGAALKLAGAPARAPMAPAATTRPGLQPSGSPQPAGRAAWLDSVELEFFNLPTAPHWDSCLRYLCSEDERCRASPPGSVPCCEDKLLQMASDLGSLFAQLNLTYFAGFSTLLGIMRNGSVQPNPINMDLDFVLDAASYDLLTSPAQGAMARYALFRKGYTVFQEMGVLRVCFNAYSPGMVPAPPKTERSTAYVDDFKYGDLYRLVPVCTKSRPIELPRANSRASCTGPQLVVRGDPRVVYNESDLFPLRHVWVPGVAVPVPIPARAEAVLTEQYGNWTLVVSTKHALVAAPAPQLGHLRPRSKGELVGLPYWSNRHKSRPA